MYTFLSVRRTNIYIKFVLQDANKIPAQPMIYKFNINSTISNRFAKTLVTSKVRNPETTSKEVTFTVVLPEKAFISEFVMEIDGKSYTAYVKEKEEAKNIYDKVRFLQTNIMAIIYTIIYYHYCDHYCNL